MRRFLGRLRKGGASAHEKRDAWRKRRVLFAESGLFDRDWYLARSPDLKRIGRDPLDHFAEHGALEGRDPGPGFESAYYAEQNPSFAETGLSAFEHYLRYGREAGISPTRPERVKNVEFRDLVEQSGLFDRDWYLARSPDLKRIGRDPLDHFTEHGALEGRDPGPGFESAYYAEQNPSFAETELSAFEHYLRYGRDAGIEPTRPEPVEDTELRDLVEQSGFFDGEWYLARYADVRRFGQAPLEHFLEAGLQEGRDPGPDFDSDFYAEENPTALETEMSPFEHYLRFGQELKLPTTRSQMRRTGLLASLLEESGLFDAEWYLKRNPDVRKFGADPFDHLVRAGAKEGRDPGPNFDSAYYVEQNPAFPNDGSISPLEHYLRFGRAAGIVPVGAPPYARWIDRFAALTEQDIGRIEADAAAHPMPATHWVHIVRRETEAERIRAAVADQIGARPTLGVVRDGGDLAGAERALAALPDGAVVILSAGDARLRRHAAYCFAAALSRGPPTRPTATTITRPPTASDAVRSSSRRCHRHSWLRCPMRDRWWPCAFPPKPEGGCSRRWRRPPKAIPTRPSRRCC